MNDQLDHETETQAVQPIFDARKTRIAVSSGIKLRNSAMQTLQDRVKPFAKATVDRDTTIDATALISRSPGLSMNAENLVEDVILLAASCADEQRFLDASIGIRQTIRQLATGKTNGIRLHQPLSDWHSYRFQAAGMNMRIVYKPADNGILVKGFQPATPLG